MNFAQNQPTCAELTKRRRNCNILQILYSSALTATTASAKHLAVKVIK